LTRNDWLTYLPDYSRSLDLLAVCLFFLVYIKTPPNSCMKPWSDPNSYTISPSRQLLYCPYLNIHLPPTSDMCTRTTTTMEHLKVLLSMSSTAQTGSPLPIKAKPTVAFLPPYLRWQDQSSQTLLIPWQERLSRGLPPPALFQVHHICPSTLLACDASHIIYFEALDICLKPNILQSWQLQK
jgi:hypothetical protein